MASPLRVAKGSLSGSRFAAAAARALVGAWLGFNATKGLLAVITSIVGATVGANLTLILLDIAWDRGVRDRVAATNARQTLEARPSTGLGTGQGVSRVARGASREG